MNAGERRLRAKQSAMKKQFDFIRVHRRPTALPFHYLASPRSVRIPRASSNSAFRYSASRCCCGKHSRSGFARDLFPRIGSDELAESTSSPKRDLRRRHALRGPITPRQTSCVLLTPSSFHVGTFASSPCARCGAVSASTRTCPPAHAAARPTAASKRGRCDPRAAR